MTDASKGTDGRESTGTAEKPGRRAAANGGGKGKVRAGADAVRSKIASVVWLAAVVCALFLAVGALLIALKANEENSIVQFILDGAELLDGPFSLDEGIFTFADTEDGRVKSALTNWGIAAVVYLVIGKILDRIIRP
ncbi:MAG TPA: hypothetical protein VFR87_10515 [Nocardioidaceae bacterium]|nr:hypothetical protein [Nocardioidaceae bacterium]